MRIHCFQHVSFESPGTILEWAELNGHTVSYTRFFEENFSLPELHEFDSLLIMGGYMNVDEEDKFPWLKAEKEFIKKTMDIGKKVLGICLGSQLIASALGCDVYKGKEKEIGFLPVQFTSARYSHPFFNHFPEKYTLFHWHGDTFDLPDNALLIASTDVCKHQAFLIGDNVLALQFHPEMNEPCIEQMILHDGNELEHKGTFIQNAEKIRSGYNNMVQNKKDLFLLLDKFYQGT